MRAFVTGGWRRKASVLVVALYALCLVVPVAALAAIHAPVPVHCLGEHHHGAIDEAVHLHSAAAQDEPADHGHGDAVKCCGLFGVTALAPGFLVVAIEQTDGSDMAVPLVPSLTGSRGDRIDRPPRGLVSL